MTVVTLLANPMTTSQDLIVAGSAGAPARLGVGANGQVLTVSGGVVGWVNAASGFANPMTALGDIITGGTAGASQRLPIGSTNQVLTVVGGAPAWAAAASGFTNPMTAPGDLIAATTGGAAQRLAAGSSGQVLTISGGLPTWAAATGTPAIVSAGNLGATYTLTLSSAETWLVGTLNANNALTISGLIAGYSGYLLLTQDVTGGRTLSINGTSIPISTTASVTSALAFEYDGTNLYITLDGGSGGAGGGGGFSNPMTTPGDIITGGTSGAAGRLAAGGSGQVLTISAGVPTWQTPASGASSTVNILNYGAVANAKMVTDAAITTGTATLSSTQAAFTTADSGKLVTVGGAGASGAPLATTISSVSGGVATLAVNASTTVSAATAFYGADDSTAMTNAMNAASAQSNISHSACLCVLPSGYTFMFKTKRRPPSGVYVWAYGATILPHWDTNSAIIQLATTLTINTFGIFGGSWFGTGTEDQNMGVWRQESGSTCNNFVAKDMLAQQMGSTVMGVTGTGVLIENNQLLDVDNSPVVFTGSPVDGLNVINFGDSSDVVVRGNIITGTWTAAIAGVYGSTTEAKVVVANNVCIGDSASYANLPGSIDFEIAQPSGVQTSSGFTVVGNDVDHRGHSGGQTAGGGINFAKNGGNWTQVVISGNRVQSWNKAIHMTASDALITDNVLRAPTPIDSSGAATPPRMSNNTFSAGPYQGRAVLVAGTVTVSTPEVTASDSIILSRVVTGGTVGHLTVGTITAGTSFVINSSSATDTSTVFWKIDH